MNIPDDLAALKPKVKSKKGGRRNPPGGRPKGRKNDPKECVAEICARMGFNPFELMVNVAKSDHKALGYEATTEHLSSSGNVIKKPTINLEQRVKAAAELMPHVAPTLKQVDLKADVSTDESLKAEIAELKALLGIPE